MPDVAGMEKFLLMGLKKPMPVLTAPDPLDHVPASAVALLICWKLLLLAVLVDVVICACADRGAMATRHAAAAAATVDAILSMAATTKMDGDDEENLYGVAEDADAHCSCKSLSA